MKCKLLNVGAFLLSCTQTLLDTCWGNMLQILHTRESCLACFKVTCPGRPREPRDGRYLITSSLAQTFTEGLNVMIRVGVG